jgi:hypothetical protein
MLNQDKFKLLSESIFKDEDISKEDVKELLLTVYELDANLVIAQYALQLAVENAMEVIPGLAEKTLSFSGRTDGKIKKKVAKYAAEVTARYELAIQMYLSGASEQAQEMLSKLASGEITLSEESTEEETINNNEQEKINE